MPDKTTTKHFAFIFLLSFIDLAKSINYNVMISVQENKVDQTLIFTTDFSATQ